MLFSEMMVQAVRRKKLGCPRLRGYKTGQECFPRGREVRWVSGDGGNRVVVRRGRVSTYGIMYVRKTKVDLPGEGRACLGKGICACVVCADTQG